MNDTRISKPKNKTAGLSAYSLVFTGVAVILVSVLGKEVWHWAEWAVHFLRDLGLLLAAVMAGTIFHEKLLRDEMSAEFLGELDAKFSRLRLDTAEEVHRLFTERPPTMTGIRKLDEVRRNFSGYYQWVNERRPQNLFFAGRSVLHRIEADIRARTNTSAAEVLVRRLKEGSKINILFLDPRINIIERLSREEGQPLEAMLGDIATSLKICCEVAQLLENHSNEFPPGAELSIRVYDRIPYFAYHKQDTDAIVGFYFDSYGSTSAAYGLIDDQTKRIFEDHFVRILSEAATTTIVEFNGARGKPTFKASLVKELQHRIESTTCVTPSAGLS